MSRVITFSRYFPATHSRKGEPTYFVEKIWKSIWDAHTRISNPLAEYWEKYDAAFPLQYNDAENIHNHAPKRHTIRAGNRWKAGDVFSPRVWTGKPYASKQLQFADAIEIKKVLNFEIRPFPCNTIAEIFIDGAPITYDILKQIALNDGLGLDEFNEWFMPRGIYKPFKGQILCWDETVNYSTIPTHA